MTTSSKKAPKSADEFSIGQKTDDPLAEKVAELEADLTTERDCRKETVFWLLSCIVVLLDILFVILICMFSEGLAKILMIPTVALEVVAFLYFSERCGVEGVAYWVKEFNALAKLFFKAQHAKYESLKEQK